MNHRKTFYAYVVPSVLAFALSGVYAIVDGFFVGNRLGDAGLTAINLAYPVPALIQAVGTGIGLAGAIRFSILNAQGKTEEGKEYGCGTLLLLAMASMLFTGLMVAFSLPVLGLLGAAGSILTMANDYAVVIALGAVFQVFGTGLVPFLRNLGGASLAMAAMIAGFLTNILLDYLFVWVCQWGMTGAAAATIIGQGITMLCTIVFLVYKKMALQRPRVSRLPAIFGAILLVSISPFGLTFTPNITLMLMNRLLLTFGNENSVAAYACIAYIISIVYLLLQGIGDGSQPLISKYYGENAVPDMQKIRLLAYRTGGVVTLVAMAALFFSRRQVGLLFGASATVRHDVAAMLPIFLVSLLLLSFVKITTSYFYATEQSALSYLLVYAEPLLLFALSVMLAPAVGVIGVWVSVPLAQGLTWVIACFAKRRVDRNLTPA